MTKQKPLISIVIPIFNEYEGIPSLVGSLNDFFSVNQTLKGEVIFVNDGSTDNSCGRLKETSHLMYSAKIITLSKNFGSHAALRAGIANASGDYICFNYADLQDPLELILSMNARMLCGNDIVWAQRESTSVPLVEKLFSKVYAVLMRKFAFQNFPDKGFDIVMFNRKVAEEVNKNVEANSSIFLQILGLGFKQDSITYKKKERKHGVSKWTVGKKIKLFIDSFVAFSFAPIRLVSIVGIMLFFLGLGWTIYIVFRKIIYDDLASGWPAMVSILMVGFGITNISLGIIAEYLWRTLDVSRRRPVFVVDELLEINQFTNDGKVPMDLQAADVKDVERVASSY
jgi:glycosyltransferase involved in cell wall biosynthesis